MIIPHVPGLEDMVTRCPERSDCVQCELREGHGGPHHALAYMGLSPLAQEARIREEWGPPFVTDWTPDDWYATEVERMKDRAPA